MHDVGYNYRITDFQCALGSSQLKRLDQFVEKRREIAGNYNESFSNNDMFLIPGIHDFVGTKRAQKKRFEMQSVKASSSLVDHTPCRGFA